MSMNRVQFQHGLSLPEFLAQYGTRGACERALQKARWPDGFVCPKCAGKRCRQFRRGGLRYFHCRRCRHQASLIAGTVFASTHLPLTTWFLGLYLVTQTKNGIAEMDQVVPWPALCAEIEPVNPKGRARGGRRPIGLEPMLRTHLLQQ